MTELNEMIAWRERECGKISPKEINEAWRLMNRVYYHLRHQGAPRESMALVNKLAGELFEDMFKEEAA